MKKKFLAMVMACMSLASMANNAGISSIFGNYWLASVEYKETGGDYSSSLVLSYENDKLVKVTESGSWGDVTHYTFDYSKIGENKVVMSCKDGYSSYNIELVLNEQGFVSKSYHNNGEWYEFTYNEDKRIECMKQHHEDGEIEITTMTYANGDLVKVEENDGDSYQIAYTSGDVTSPIANIANLMYKCDLLWGIDLDEYNYVYLAGLLGMAPAHLPVLIKEDGDTQYFTWKLNENGTPVECSFDYRIYRYDWNINTTGINAADQKKSIGNGEYYNINGQKVAYPANGVYILGGKKVVMK